MPQLEQIIHPGRPALDTMEQEGRMTMVSASLNSASTTTYAQPTPSLG